MMFRNPTPAAMLVLGWETINPVLPSLLQKISVASYLRHLMPVTVSSDGIFALLTVETEPVSGWAAAAGLLILSPSFSLTPAIAFARSKSNTRPSSEARDKKCGRL